MRNFSNFRRLQKRNNLYKVKLIGFLRLSVAAFVLLNACEKRSGTYEKLPNGVLITLPEKGENDVRSLKLEVISNKIIHVMASQSTTFSKFPSLMVEHKERTSVDWTANEDKKGEVTLSTDSLTARVSLFTGEITFTDKAGNVILQEKEGGGKSFQKVSLEDSTYYAIRQEFNSPGDEAFYGLGQHQNGEMNYKGKDVELAQHNIVAVIPFLYSSKNYGLLWDNYSITRFGDPREYQPLSSLKLFSKTGEPGGLTADYYVGDNIKEIRQENEINFEYLETPQVDSFPRDVARNGKVVWEGSVASDIPGEHKFLLYASGYFKLWIDGNLIMDKWRQNWNPWSNKFSIAMQKDERHSIKLEWITQGGYLALKHLDPLPEKEQNELSLYSEVADQIDYYFIKGSNADDVIHGYRELTGKASLVPKWALGFWQSRERYKTQEELLETVRRFRKEQIPLDNIVLDWNYWPEDKWGSHAFDASRFPDPAAMVKEIHDKLHAHIMISVWPKFYPGTDNYEEMQKNGYLFKRNIEKGRRDWIAQGYQNTFYDPFNPGARKLFWDQIDARLNNLGFDAWWLDATEPDMHSNLSIEERKLNMSPTALGPGAKYFNAYSLMNSKGVYEGQRQSDPDRRVFILTRSAYAGQQRYGSVTWSGDIVSRWSDFKDQISAGVNFSLSGIPYWTMDIGGFAVENRYYNPSSENVDEWRELNTRWYEFGSFCPIFRVHGQFPYREIYNVSPKGSEAYDAMLYYDKLRYRLMPYTYSLAGKTYLDDYTIMRGLIMDFAYDANVRNVNDAYMFGSALLVNPVTTYKARTREVYLPSGFGWYELYTGKHFDGGQTITVDAPLNRTPVFVKEGSILPAGPEIQYTSERPADPVTLYVYDGKNGSFELYEDENENYNYEKGKYSIIPFHYDAQTGTLTIEERKGSFTGMLDKRTFNVIWVDEDSPVGVSLEAKPQQVVQYEGKRIDIKNTNP